MSAGRFCVVLVTAGSGREAKKIATAVLKDHLAACVNIVPGVISHFWWKGKLLKGRESLLLIKTRRSLVPEVETRVKAVHSYCTPETISLPIVRGNRDYLRWLAAETK